jgi:hypothetical protein
LRVVLGHQRIGYITGLAGARALVIGGITMRLGSVKEPSEYGWNSGLLVLS